MGTGNLTFLRRDIVVRRHGPVVFGRVYDTTIHTNADLGPGWRLSLAEELHVSTDGFITYIDGFGGQHRFHRKSGDYVPNPPNPWHMRTAIAARDTDVVLTQTDGTIRTFKQHGKNTGRFLIKSLKTSHGLDIKFSYVNGLLAEVTSDGTRLFVLDRSSDGRLARVTDSHGRSVTYSYTAAGQLKDVYDLAGNVWWHEYNKEGLLTSAVGANRRPYLRVAYDYAGRVIESSSGRRYQYAYSPNQTTVTEGTGERHIFVQDSSGITVKYKSTDREWEVDLDEDNRVQSMRSPERTIHYSYRAGGNIETVVDSLDTEDQKFNYDAQGQLIAVTSSAGRTKVDISYSADSVHLTGAEGRFEFTTSPAGVVTRLKDVGSQTEFVYDDNGYLVRLQRSGRSVRFQRDSLGRVIATTYPNGRTNTYSYDRLGNRTRVEYADGGSTAYTHDAAGNITAVDVNEANGRTRRQTVQIADMNRVDQIVYERSGALRITYDDLGRPSLFETPRDSVSVKYTSTGAVQSLTSKSVDEVWEPSDDEQPQNIQLDDPRLIALARDRVFAPRRDYGVLAFSDVNFAPTLRDPIAQGVPHLEDAQSLAAVARSVLWEEHANPIEFEKPSNPIFQPDEYRATNCCVPCSYWCGDCYTGGSIASASLCYCAGSRAGSFSVRCGSVRSYPVLSSCTFIAQNNRPVVPDGCSFVPDDPCRVAGDCTLAVESTSFTPACNAHDVCYRTCGSDRLFCDVAFPFDLKAICDRAYPSPCPYKNDKGEEDKDKCDKYKKERGKCRNYAGGYTIGVWGGGKVPYRNNQVRFCDCCNITFGGY